MKAGQDATIKIQLNCHFEDALKRVKLVFQQAKFEITHELKVDDNVREQLKRKYQNYTVIGFSSFIQDAFKVAPGVGMHLPVNIIIYQDSEASCILEMVNPQMMSLVLGSTAHSTTGTRATALIRRVIHEIEISCA